MILVIVPLLLVAFWLAYFLMPPPAGLPILMYHKVSEDKNDKLTVSVERLDEQLVFLRQHGYRSISFSDLKDFSRGLPLPEKPVLLTFDDGYHSVYRLAYPLLKKHRFKATVFLPTKYIGQFNDWDGGTERIIDHENIREMSSDLIEFGLHSHRHESYKTYTASQIESDIGECINSLEKTECPFVRVFAYPYGTRPGSRAGRKALESILARYSIDFAVRIGSGVNSFPLRKSYELKRIGIHGTDSIKEFGRKLKRGRTVLF